MAGLALAQITDLMRWAYKHGRISVVLMRLIPHGGAALGHATQSTNSYSIAATVSPILAGESATVTPDSLNAAILDFAVPSPPLMMAPA